MSRLFVVELVDSVYFLCPSIVCLNPPYSKNVSTNVGQSFLKIIDEEFPADYPLHKITESVIYQATVTIKDNTTNRPSQSYVGLTENSFTTRLANHKASFNSFDKRNATELSKYVWELKNRNIHYTIKWKLLKRAKPYNCASNRCNLCLWEKYFIICKRKMATLNKRNELVSACRHNKKFLLN
jgi:hypothetical protein